MIRMNMVIKCMRQSSRSALCTQVIGPKRAGHAGEGFAKAALLADVSLLPEGPNQDPVGHRAVAVATGYLDARHDELVVAPRKQVCLINPYVLQELLK